jgi:hypothetical protein
MPPKLGEGESPPQPFHSLPLKRIADRRKALPFQRGNRPRDHIYASQLGACARAVWFDWYYPGLRPDDDFNETRGALGHAVESLIAKQLGPLLVAEEVSFYAEEAHVSGRVDFVVRLKPTGPMIPVELKTTYAYDKFLRAPLPSHLLQLRYYLTQIPEAPFGILVYYNLSAWGGKSGHWTALVIPRDDGSVWARARFLWKIVHERDSPACDHEGEPEPCWGCSRSAEAVLRGRGPP